MTNMRNKCVCAVYTYRVCISHVILLLFIADYCKKCKVDAITENEIHNLDLLELNVDGWTQLYFQCSGECKYTTQTCEPSEYSDWYYVIQGEVLN